MRTDLHIHTNYSDGELSPQEVLRRAVAVGLEQVSITDHDNLHAYSEVDFDELPPGLKLVPGIELDAHLIQMSLGIRSIEILGYGIDVQCPELRERVDRLIQERRLRARALVQKLNEQLGVTVWPDELLRDKASPLIPRIMMLYLAKGHVADKGEARRLLSDMRGLPKVKKPTAEEAIELIHQAGGRAVLAHPCRTALEDAEEATTALEWLRENGLDGYEIDYPYERTSRKGPKFDILDIKMDWPDALLTGGSDCHTAGQLGTFSVDLPAWEEMCGDERRPDSPQT